MATPRTTRTRRETAVHHLVPRTRRSALPLFCELVLIAVHPSLAAAHIAVSALIHGLVAWRHRAR